MLTPYQYASNTPIWAIELEGLEGLAGPSFASVYRQVNAAVDRQTADDILDTQYKVSAAGMSLFFAVILAPAVATYGSGAYLWAASNPELVVGIGGLTASIIDPSPAHDYPGKVDDLFRGAKVLFKNSKGAEHFIFNTNRFKFFFGKGTGTEKNILKSLQRASDFAEMGIDNDKKGKAKLIELMDEAIDTKLEGPLKYNKHSGKWDGWKVVDVTEDGVSKGKVKFGVSYADEVGESVPEVSTAIPMPSKKSN